MLSLTASVSECHRDDPALRVLIVTTFDADQYVFEALNLFVSEATVRTHVGHLLSKLNARSRAQAVVVAYESGLVRPGGA